MNALQREIQQAVAETIKPLAEELLALRKQVDRLCKQRRELISLRKAAGRLLAVSKRPGGPNWVKNGKLKVSKIRQNTLY